MEVRSYWLEFVASVGSSGGILITFSWQGKEFLSSGPFITFFVLFCPVFSFGWERIFSLFNVVWSFNRSLGATVVQLLSGLIFSKNVTSFG